MTAVCPRCGDTGLTKPTETDLGFCGCLIGQARFDAALAIALATLPVGGA